MVELVFKGNPSGARPVPHCHAMKCPDSISVDIFMVEPGLPLFCLPVCSIEIKVSLCSPGLPPTEDPSCFDLSSAGITVMCTF